MQHSHTLRRLLLATALLVLSAALAAGVYTQASKSQKKQSNYGSTYEPTSVTVAPEVKSSIKGLEISGVTLINQGTPAASIAIDVINQRDEAVMALDFISCKGDRSGMAMDGYLEEGSPLVIIPPHSLRTFNWGVGGILKGTTVFLAAAVFSDGKEEGDSKSLTGIKIGRQQYQQRRREQKAKNGGTQPLVYDQL